MNISVNITSVSDGTPAFYSCDVVVNGKELKTGIYYGEYPGPESLNGSARPSDGQGGYIGDNTMWHLSDGEWDFWDDFYEDSHKEKSFSDDDDDDDEIEERFTDEEKLAVKEAVKAAVRKYQ